MEFVLSFIIGAMFAQILFNHTALGRRFIIWVCDQLEKIRSSGTWT